MANSRNQPLRQYREDYLVYAARYVLRQPFRRIGAILPFEALILHHKEERHRMPVRYERIPNETKTYARDLAISHC
jgi:hypothetical protein